jgi:Zn-dependent peptidase ImmA (M78 family)/DNA-binding XRE family transcriptional regulator
MTDKKQNRLFSGERLRLARIANGLTLVELKELVGASAPFLSLCESGRREPSLSLADALADVLGFLPGFFCLPRIEEFKDHECHFRRRRATGVSVRQQVLARATLFSELVALLEDYLDLPLQRIPRATLSSSDEVERIAERARMECGLGLDVPITRMTRVLENAGVVITRFEGLSDKVDAFSRFGSRCLVVLNDKTPSRTRWDLAHEWGHLIMHGGAATDTALAEAQADAFAAAFLLPRAAFIREFPRLLVWDWHPLMQLKERWRASLAAIVRRAFELKLINAAQYRAAYKQMSWRGWIKQEPAEFEPEEPELTGLAFEQLEDSFGMSPIDIATALYWRAETFEKVVGFSPAKHDDAPPSPSKPVVNLASVRERRRMG